MDRNAECYEVPGEDSSESSSSGLSANPQIPDDSNLDPFPKLNGVKCPSDEQSTV